MHFPRLPLFLLCGIIALDLALTETGLAASQTPDSASGLHNPAITASLPLAMRLQGGNSFLLVLSGDHYDAYREGDWHSMFSTYTVEEFNPKSIRLARTDIGGPGTAILTGKISSQGNSVEGGVFTWTAGPIKGSGPYKLTWGDALGSPLQPASTVRIPQLKTALSEDGQSGQTNFTLPETLRFCGGNCFKLRLVDGHYEGYREDGDTSVIHAIYVINRFSPQEVRLIRIDLNDGGRGILDGKMSAQQNSMIDGVFTWISGMSGAGPLQLTWDKALPMAAKTTGTHGPDCDLSDPLNVSAETAYQYGIDAYHAKDYGRFHCWSTKSSEHGFSRATTMLGVAYASGKGVDSNPVKAFDLLQTSANKGDPYGEYLLSLCYRDGIGTVRDEEEATRWMAKAMATDEGRAIDAGVKQQAAEARAQQQAGNFLWRFLFGMFVGGDGDAPSSEACQRMRGQGNPAGQALAYNEGCR